jgi:hypothetical protein
VTSFVVRRSQRIQIDAWKPTPVPSFGGNPLIRNDILLASKTASRLGRFGHRSARVSERTEGDNMTSAYSLWVGQAVILQVAANELRVPLRGVIVGESESTVRFRVGEGWDIDIYKHMILAVEQDNWAGLLAN